MRSLKAAPQRRFRLTKIFVLLVAFIAFLPLISEAGAAPENKITNGTLETDAIGWTFVNGSSGGIARSSLLGGGGSPATTWAIRANTTTRRSTATHTATYPFTYSGGAVSATLGYWFRKLRSGAINTHAIRVYLNGPNDTADQQVWSHTGTASVAWTQVAAFNVLPRLQAGGAGTWTLKITFQQDYNDSGGSIAGAIDEFQLMVDAGADTQPPTTSITYPTGASNILGGASETITGNANDISTGNSNINTVEVRIQKTSTGEYWNNTAKNWTGTSASWAPVNTFTPATNVNWSFTWDLTNVQGQTGTLTVDARATDAAPTPNTGTATPVTGVQFDTVPPAGTMNINNNATYTNTTTVPVSQGGISGAALHRLTTDGVFDASSSIENWATFTTTASVTLSPPDGTKTVTGQYADADESNNPLNIHSPPSDSIILDQTAPTAGTVSPAEGATLVSRGTKVTAAFNEANEIDPSTISDANVYLTVDGSPTHLPATLTLTGSAGAQSAVIDPTALLDPGTVYRATVTTGVRDLAGSALSPANKTWTFTTIDDVGPSSSITAPLSTDKVGGISYTITGTASDTGLGGSGITQTRVRITKQGGTPLYWDGAAQAWTTVADTWNTAHLTSTGAVTTNWDFVWGPPQGESGTLTVEARSTDQPGNLGATASVANVTFDTIAPTVTSFLINSDATYTNTATVTLNNSASDANGPLQMRFANSLGEFATSSYEAYAATRSNWNLGSGDGARTVYVQYRDAAGNVTTQGAAGTFDSIILDTTGPQAGTVDPPAGGTGPLNTNVTVQFVEANNVNGSSVTDSTFWLEDTTNPGVHLAATLNYDSGTKMATLNPSSDLIQDRVYHAYVTGAIVDLAGNQLQAPRDWTFTATPPDLLPPSVSTITSPTASQLITGPQTTFTVTGNAQDDVRVQTVTVTIRRSSDNYYWNGDARVWQTASYGNAAAGFTPGPNVNWTYVWEFNPTYQDGTPSYTLTARAIDGTGKFLDSSPVAGVTVDNNPPQGSMNLNDGAQYANSATVTAYNNFTGATEMRHAETTTALASATWVSYTSTSSFTFATATNETKTVYAQYRDANLNATAIGGAGTLDSIILDTAGPTVGPTSLAGTGIARNTNVTVTFTETNAMDAATITDSTFWLEDTTAPGVHIPASLSYSAGTKTATLDPYGPSGTLLQPNRVYQAFVTTGVRDAAGNPLAAAQNWTFTTTDDLPPDSQITQPISGDRIGATTSYVITGNASDGATGGSGITKVELRITKAGAPNQYWVESPTRGWTTDSANPNIWIQAHLVSTGAVTTNWDFAWTLPQNDSGSLTIEGRATDAASNLESTLATVTGVTLDTQAPAAPVITSPTTAVTVTTAGYSITGTAEANALVQVYNDANNNNLKDTGETVVASQQLSGGATSFSVSTPLAVGTNNFVVTAKDAPGATGNESAAADVPTITREATEPPAAPTGLTANPATPYSIDLSWTASPGATGYKVYRRDTPTASFVNIATIGATTTYRDTSLTPSTSYSYQVTATNAYGESGPSNTASATTPAAQVPAPQGGWWTEYGYPSGDPSDTRVLAPSGGDIYSPETPAGGATPSLHGNFTTSSNRCKYCHAVHQANDTSFRLLRSANRSSECDWCHAKFTGRSSHRPYEEMSLRGVPVNGEHTPGAMVVPDSAINGGGAGWGNLPDRGDGGTGLNCYDCHTVHGGGRITIAGTRWDLAILRQDPAGNGAPCRALPGDCTIVDHKGTSQPWNSAVMTQEEYAKVAFCSDCHNMNPDVRNDASDGYDVSLNSAAHPTRGDGYLVAYDTKVQVSNGIRTCFDCHSATTYTKGDDRNRSPLGPSDFPHQSAGHKLLTDTYIDTLDTAAISTDPFRPLPVLDKICLGCHGGKVGVTY